MNLKEHLEKYFESRLQEMVRHYDWRLNQLDRSRQEQAEQFDRRLQSMDDLQRTKFPTRDDMQMITDQFTGKTQAMDIRFSSDIAELKEYRAELKGKASNNSVIFSIIMAVAALATSIIKLFIPT